MIHTFPIEFLRQALEQHLLKKHIENPNYFGGSNQIQLFSFYEQLKGQDEVDRFVERYRDLTEQQNRANLIGNGILLSPENPTITNLYSSLIIPMTWTCSIRTMLQNRDQMIETLFELIDELKGRKVDIAELKCEDENGKVYYQPFCVGTIGHNEEDGLYIKSGDYIGNQVSSPHDITNAEIWTMITNLKTNAGVRQTLSYDNHDYLYVGKVGSPYQMAVITGKQHNQTTIGSIMSFDYLSTTSTTYTIRVKFTSSERYLKTPDVGTISCGSKSFNVKINDVSSTVSATGVLESTQFVDNQYIAYFNFSFTKTSGATVEFVSISGSPVATISGIKKVYVWQEIEDDGEYDNIIFPEENDSFVKYKLSMSFDSLRCDTPKTLNGNEYCEISFGGSATLVSEGVKLGNDLVKLAVSKNKIVAATDITFTPYYYWLEPLEMPSGNGAGVQSNLLVSNFFKANSHTDSNTIVLQYTFIADSKSNILEEWFDYGRYGITENDIGDYTITPNIIYDVAEYWSSWGNVKQKAYLGKLIESVDIENTESDTLTLSITMQLQGENN